jgi:hypothetical protein
MIKFKQPEDAKRFFLEVGRADLAVKQSQPDEEMYELFIKSRRDITGRLKNFRRQQGGREAWRKNRYGYMKGIRSFHKSTDGKRFHRAMGRFLTGRILNREQKREGLDFEGLKALSSLRTHYYIEREFYHSLDEEVDLLIIGEELLPVIARVESQAVRGEEISEDDIDFLLAFTHPNDIQLELAEVLKTPIEQIRTAASTIWATLDMTRAGAFVAFVRSFGQPSGD